MILSGNPLFNSDCFDLTQHALWKGLNSHTASGCLGSEILSIYFVKCSKVTHICQEAGCLLYTSTACIEGESSWFSQWDQIELCWNYVSRLKKLYSDTDLPLYSYVPGTPGPGEAERMLGQGEHWLL